MTLREFTKEYLPLPDAEYGSNNPFWRREFPTRLRWHNIVFKEGYYKYGLFSMKWVPEISTKELEERWERVHKGEIIDTEWRKLYTF